MALNTIGQGECLNSPGIAKLSGRFSDGIGLFQALKSRLVAGVVSVSTAFALFPLIRL